MTLNIYLFTGQMKAEMGEADEPLGVTLSMCLLAHLNIIYTAWLATQLTVLISVPPLRRQCCF